MLCAKLVEELQGLRSEFCFSFEANLKHLPVLATQAGNTPGYVRRKILLMARVPQLSGMHWASSPTKPQIDNHCAAAVLSSLACWTLSTTTIAGTAPTTLSPSKASTLQFYQPRTISYFAMGGGMNHELVLDHEFDAL